jgi:hypothetical protein
MFLTKNQQVRAIRIAEAGAALTLRQASLKTVQAPAEGQLQLSGEIQQPFRTGTFAG